MIKHLSKKNKEIIIISVVCITFAVAIAGMLGSVIFSKAEEAKYDSAIEELETLESITSETDFEDFESDDLEYDLIVGSEDSTSDIDSVVEDLQELNESADFGEMEDIESEY